MKDILAIDVGTTALKMGVFDSNLISKRQVSRNYEINLHDRVCVDIDPDIWWSSFLNCCKDMRDLLKSVGVISFSVTTPGLVPMTANGKALGPAILFMDGRSSKQANEIRRQVGEEHFLTKACNLPVSGGSSLSSIMWIKENQPEIWRAAEKFGHCNSYMVRQLTGLWAIDPSTASITGMYNTALDNLTWNEEILSAAGISQSQLPTLMRSHSRVGNISPEIASILGCPVDTAVLCGGNDAVLAALSGGLPREGDITSIHGTCDITTVFVDKPIASPNFNVRCHVIPGRWVTFFVLNTGGKALEWFHSLFCKEMSREQFFEEYVPRVLVAFLDHPLRDSLEQDLPTYVPYLQGSRYSLDPLSAGFSGLKLQTTREQMLLAMVKGNLSYQADHIREVSRLVKLSRNMAVSGGEARIKGFLQAKKRWTGDFDYRFQDQSSLIGAAILGSMYNSGASTPTEMMRELEHCLAERNARQMLPNCSLGDIQSQ